MPSDAERGPDGDERGCRRGGRPRRLERPRHPRPGRRRPRALEEVHRFPNEPVQLDDGLHWDALRLHHEILTGLRRAARSAPGLREHRHRHLGRRRRPARRAPGRSSATRSTTATRDNRGAVERVHARIPQEDLFARNGLQFMPFNTLYQLEAAARHAAVRDRAHESCRCPTCSATG